MAKKPNSKKNSIHSPLFNSKLQGLFFLVLGFLLILMYVVWKINQIVYFPENIKVTQAYQLSNTRPAQVVIPKIGLEIKTDLTSIKNGVWEVSRDNASYLINSALPGKKGNIIIYGHNTSNIFGRLKQLKEGDEIKIVTEGKENYLYKVTSTQVVSPTEIEPLYPTSEEVLTIYTCTGFLDSQRLVVRAAPISID